MRWWFQGPERDGMTDEQRALIVRRRLQLNEAETESLRDEARAETTNSGRHLRLVVPSA
jgi:hypothetical protein